MSLILTRTFHENLKEIFYLFICLFTRKEDKKSLNLGSFYIYNKVVELHCALHFKEAQCMKKKLYNIRRMNVCTLHCNEK